MGHSYTKCRSARISKVTAYFATSTHRKGLLRFSNAHLFQRVKGSHEAVKGSHALV